MRCTVLSAHSVHIVRTEWIFFEGRFTRYFEIHAGTWRHCFTATARPVSIEFMNFPHITDSSGTTGNGLRRRRRKSWERLFMSVLVLYTTKATATGGRDGRATTDDGSLDVTMTTPKELGGTGGPGNNPEQLFAAGFATCFLNAIRFVASQGGPKVPDDAKVAATVGIGPQAQGGFGLDVQLDISLPGLAQADADSLVQRAQLVCPYSNAIRNNVPVRLVIV
jgi:lipoyl-dependent peroxiredoxin